MPQDDNRDDREPGRPAEKAAFERRAAALRANLKRRKAQLRGRVSGPAPSAGDSDPSRDGGA